MPSSRAIVKSLPQNAFALFHRSNLQLLPHHKKELGYRAMANLEEGVLETRMAAEPPPFFIWVKLPPLLNKLYLDKTQLIARELWLFEAYQTALPPSR